MLEPLIVQPDELHLVAAKVDGLRPELANDATPEEVASTESLVTGSLIADELSAVGGSLLVVLSVVVDQLATSGEGVGLCATDYARADAATARGTQAVAE